jgi:hypothetical protein
MAWSPDHLVESFRHCCLRPIQYNTRPRFVIPARCAISCTCPVKSAGGGEGHVPGIHFHITMIYEMCSCDTIDGRPGSNVEILVTSKTHGRAELPTAASLD